MESYAVLYLIDGMEKEKIVIATDIENAIRKVLFEENVSVTYADYSIITISIVRQKGKGRNEKH